MTDWTAGYVADVGYTYGYYPELNPQRITLALLNSGCVPPEVGTACELGFGQGVSANLHAAASMVKWYGTDFNPSQAALAMEMADAARSDARLFDEAFSDFYRRTDLPDFDFISLHGIWSWISDENRAVIVDFVRRKLKIGGVLYISYNTLPGWSQYAPIRHLMVQHASCMGAVGEGIIKRIDGALEYVEKILATNPAYSRANPTVKERFLTLKGERRNYLAHEYFNRDWQPMYFADTTRWLSPAKISFACSANLLDHVDAINLSAEQLALLGGISDVTFRQTVRDYCVNQQFRKEYWIKGLRKLSVFEQAERLRALRLMLTTSRKDVSLKVNGSLGEATMSGAVYNPVLDVLADHKPRTIAQLEKNVASAGIRINQLTQAIMILAGSGHLGFVQNDAIIEQSATKTRALNFYLQQKARHGADVSYLASPVTGSGYLVGRFEQLFLLALHQGMSLPQEWAEFVWGIVASQGQCIVKEGTALQTPEENLAELEKQAQVFREIQLPVLKALQIA